MTHRAALTLALLALSQLITSLDYFIVYVALPDIGQDLGFSAQSLQWVASAYAVAYGGFLLLGGRAADLLGHRRMFVAATALFAFSSLAGGLAESQTLLVAARAVQGLGGALLFPATLALVNTRFAEGPARNRALGVWSGAGASGLALGSLLGGLLTGAWGWQAVFYVNVPLAGIAIAGAYLLIPADGPRTRGRRFDLPGAVLATAGVSLLAFALIQGPESGWTSPPILGGAVLAAVLLAAFVVVERRGDDALMPLRLFGNRSLRSAIAVILVFGVTFNALPYFLTVYFRTVLGYGAVATGLAFLVPALLIALGTQLGGRLAGRIGMRSTLLIGTAGGAVGAALVAFGVSADGSYANVLPGIVIMGIGQGLTWTGMWIAAATGVAGREQGVASGMASTALQVGSALGLAVLVAAGGVGAATGAALATGLRTAVFLSALGMLLGAAVALTFARERAAEPALVSVEEL
ncbi:drug resistance transporter, EmrB/QacA subfamily [Nonomuraea solani]|uniref:Drug resistance transporter, EmrB/QacA subfamily n=1 Tax=Nonomuraea solani TaxID=1144553 RepID=A0A1H6F251_9ACTN|nr:MFS transporter [Nonomuraea solani]SEH03279.1 drug resistance transporter, EmrB/QacA subfamily [Nonomuraea solani]